jgi:hypothetical protein
MGSCYVTQIGLELLCSSNPPHSLLNTWNYRCLCHCTRPDTHFLSELKLRYAQHHGTHHNPSTPEAEAEESPVPAHSSWATE